MLTIYIAVLYHTLVSYNTHVWYIPYAYSIFHKCMAEILYQVYGLPDSIWACKCLVDIMVLSTSPGRPQPFVLCVLLALGSLTVSALPTKIKVKSQNNFLQGTIWCWCWIFHFNLSLFPQFSHGIYSYRFHSSGHSTVYQLQKHHPHHSLLLFYWRHDP